MSWTIGKITLPLNPNRISNKSTNAERKVPVHIESAWLMHMGPDDQQLQIKGEIWDNDASLDTLDTNYVTPLHRYHKRPMAIDIPLLDISGHGDWVDDGASSIKNTGNTYVKNDESLRVIFGAANIEIYYELDQQTDFSDHNIVSLWIKGGANNKFKLTFYNETYSGRTNGYRCYPSGGTSSWNRNVFAISTIDGSPAITNTVGTPTGWDDIRTVVIEPSGTWNPGATPYHFDNLVVGFGWQVKAPRSVYDGIWTIKSFQADEVGGNIHSYEYSMVLLNKDDYFGLDWKAV